MSSQEIQNTEETPAEAFNPAAEALRLRQNMQHFQAEINKLRAQTEDARAKTLMSIQEGIHDAATNGLHNSLFPQTQPPTSMDSSTPNDQNTESTQQQPGISSGEDAMNYTDAHMTQVIQNMQGQLGYAMGVSAQREAAAVKSVESAVKNTTEAINSEEATNSETGSQTQDNTPTPLDGMNQAQQNVSDIVNGSTLPSDIA